MKSSNIKNYAANRQISNNNTNRQIYNINTIQQWSRHLLFHVEEALKMGGNIIRLIM